MELQEAQSSVPSRTVSSVREIPAHLTVKKRTSSRPPLPARPGRVGPLARQPADARGAWHNGFVNRRLRRNTSLLLALAVVASACGSAAGTGSPSAPAASTDASAARSSSIPVATGSDEEAIYDRIEAQVEKLRSLAPKTPVHPVLLDEEGVRSWMTKSMESVDHEALAAQSRLFAHLGLLAAGASIEQLELDLNSSQAVGFYDPESKQLFLLSQSGSVGPEERLVFSHEYTHALQDQNFDLAKLAIDTPDQSDRDLGHLAVIEGDATLAMTQWAQANMSLGDLLAVSLSAGSGAQAAQLAAAPAILREDLLFPYEEGLVFVQGVYAQGGWKAVDKLYANPPASTSQILHPDLYARNVLPTVLTVPSPSPIGSGWRITMQDTMGELQLRVWLEGESPSASQRTAAANAVGTWAGDRIALYEGPNDGWAVVLRTEWRSTAGRNAFAAAARQRVGGLTGESRVCGDATHADVVLASSLAILAAMGSCSP
jgi:hypothetical protein